ncbi:MAG: ATP-binding cassette domain-containing protein [Castellaniella sp.]|uniref:ABC transporter ATP-binding protein n=1 Tax=Castellaniella sp. TaxID=1955812 RepID=UPI003C730B34
MFQLDQAGYSLPEKVLLHPTSVEFHAAGIYGLIGHNGSGKSTLLKLLAGHLKATSGRVDFDGQAVARWPQRRFAREIAYLPQHLPPSEHLTALELIQFGRYPWQGLLGRASAQDKAAVDRAIELTQTQAYRHQRVDTLSGGERQRVWLAMLLAQNSRFLLLDEPLAPLDIAHQTEVLALIHRLSRELGLGIMLVLHDINQAARYCDQLVALGGGRIIASGAPAEIMTSAQLQHIYGTDMSIVSHPRLGIPVALAN